MAKTKKVNPRRVPCTQADVIAGQKYASRSTAVIIFSVLLDKHGYSKDDLQDIWRGVSKLSVEIAEKRLSIKDLAEVLHNEYGIDVTE